MVHDLVIRGGTVIDGTGAPGRRADVAIDGDRVADVGEDLTGRRELDAGGRVVAPGFIDIHTHYDAQVFWDPALTPSSWHGVTTVVAGNCGFSIAPCRAEHRSLIGRTLQHVEDMSLATLEAGIPWDFESFPEYLDAVERRGVGLNFTAYVGHTAVRLYVMGDEGYEREEPTDDELAQMAQVVRNSVAAGAAGFATSSAPTHSGDGGRPVPSRLAGLAELEALLRPLGDLGRGVAELTPGERIRHADVYELQKRVRRPFTWTALLTVRGSPFATRMAALNADERADGADVWPQVTCRPLTFQMTLAEPFTFNTVPAFRALMDRPEAERLAAYRDPAWRRAAQDELATGRVFRPQWDTVTIAESRDHPELEGRSVAALARERGVEPLDALLELAVAEDLSTRVRAVLANDDEDMIASLLRQEGMLIGLSDAGAHVGQLCDACLPTDLLGNWVRERPVLTLEAAVHKLTGEPAAVFGFTDRGVLEPGRAADVTVFDPDTVAPGKLRRVRDFPADGERLVADSPVGVAHVLVNGTPIRVDGEPVPDGLDARPGRVLRS
ncbi:MAG TPA: amidohydrolase family protein [Acidimicrobiia bacterium]|nr:amidohydrolase family protein [Acidimicrobiia bacterium]